MQDDNKKEDIEKDIKAYMNWYERVQQIKEKQKQHIIYKQKAAKKQVYEMPEVRLDTFKQSNSKLSKNKSQLPNLAVQSRIFPPTKKGRRKFNQKWQSVPVFGRQDITIWQRFFQLNQLDLTGWLVLIKFAGPDLVASFTRYEFLKAMRKTDSSRDYNWLRAFLDRISGTQFAIYLHNEDQSWERYTGSLAPQDYERSDGLHAVQLSKPLYALFSFDGWSFINLDQRLKLGQNQWAQAFHAWASTHTCPHTGFWFTKHKLWQEWGAEYKDFNTFLKKFRTRVLKPLKQLDFLKQVHEKPTAIGLWW